MPRKCEKKRKAKGYGQFGQGSGIYHPLKKPLKTRLTTLTLPQCPPRSPLSSLFFLWNPSRSLRILNFLSIFSSRVGDFFKFHLFVFDFEGDRPWTNEFPSRLQLLRNRLVTARRNCDEVFFFFFLPLLRPRRSGKMDHHDETGCQAPEGPILCINNCGFFGSAATMNMCSKCHKDLVLKQEQAKLAASSIDSIVNGSSSSSKGKDPVIVGSADVAVSSLEPKILTSQEPNATTACEVIEVKPKEGPNRCNACRKRVGLTGFNCRCGNLFCNLHRYSDKHNCPFDYHTAARDAIAKANPVVKAEKLDKI